ncbi:hemin-degrading factor [Psychrobacter sp. TAE2020]|uniref:ChuX/HutX family heme-like substrate-binding protein n=1 Tax=Psychrobacter sp. TAE2020 TaxID=2846762 RepID=UPI001C115001|nr:ChuX/HutX family heme-like substrate-binding protein [Psychrobacter sp. TAE2020]MBU5615929.1 hemin-degrading factor [Psychrobacter sp. TAE2020]
MSNPLPQVSTVTLSLSKKDNALWQAYQDKKSQTSMLFPTEGAFSLGVSEFELMSASPNSEYMGDQCKAVLEQLETFSQVESIVRNELAVHEKQGQYHNLKLGEKMGIALNIGGLDLRFFMWRWRYMLAVSDTSRADKPSYSIQFYNEQGDAIDKVYLRDMSQDAVMRWQDMVEQQIATVTDRELTLEVKDELEEWQYKVLSADKRDELQRRWRKMTDVHQFYYLLNKLQIDRASSYRQAPEHSAYPLSIDAVVATFEQARDSACPIMIFVGNSGMVQIQTGTVHTLKRIGDWFNVLDKSHNNFTLHLKDQALGQVWCVKRPTKDGVVTCIEGFDNKGVSIFSLFGQRIEGTPELEAWRTITANIVAKYAQSSTTQDSNALKLAIESALLCP